MNAIKQIWLTIRSNPYFVAFEGAFTGALFNYVSEAFMSGKVDFTKAGTEKMLAFAVTAGITAVRLLNRPPAGANPNPKP